MFMACKGLELFDVMHACFARVAQGRHVPFMATDKPFTSSGDLWTRLKRDRPQVPGWNAASSSRSQVAKEKPLPPVQ